MILTAYWLGKVDYRKAWELQNYLAEELARGRREPSILLLEHPHTFTIGRRGNRDHILFSDDTLRDREIEVIDVDRGGDVTYHGPGQLVGYPILKVEPPDYSGGFIGKANYIGYIRRLEAGIIDSLAHFGVRGMAIDGYTGVWIDERENEQNAFPSSQEFRKPRKISSIGVKIDSRGITRHGFALNVSTDLSYWAGIIPCGLHGVDIANLCDLVDPLPSAEEIRNAVLRGVSANLGLSVEYGREPLGE
jgi:lipoate-protein ligase B